MRRQPPARRSRILYVVTEDWYFWSHRSALARAARDAGYEVHVATHLAALRGEIEAEGFRVHHTRLRRGWNGIVDELRAALELVLLIRRLQPDLVHQVSFKPVLYGSLATRWSRRVRVVNTLPGRGFIFSSPTWRARILRPALFLALYLLLDHPGSRVLVQNREDAEFVVRSRLVSKERVVLVRGSGVDTARFSPQPEPPAPLVVALVSRMLWDKGVGVLVEAARAVKSRRSVRFLLVGPIDPNNPGAISERQLRAWADSGLVDWTGPTSDAVEVWRGAHIAVLPTYYGEGLPKTLLEAAACGRPMIATDVPGCREIVLEGETGLLVPTRDPAALTEALIRLIDDAALRGKMGANARRLVENAFSDARVASETLAVYRELLTDSKS